MPVFTSLYNNATRVQTVNGKGQPLVATLDWGVPYVSTLNNERIIAAASAGAGAVRAGLTQYNEIKSPQSADAWSPYNTSTSLTSSGGSGPVAGRYSSGGLGYFTALANGSAEFWGAGQTLISVQPGEEWNFSFWCKTDGNFNASPRLYVDVYNGGSYDTTFLESQFKGFDGGAWSQHSMAFTIPTGGSGRTMSVYCMMSENSSISPSGRYARFSGVMLTRGLDLKNFFDGDTGPASKGWEGTPKFSRSYQVV